VRAVRGINLKWREVRPSLFSGPNGAGKTTTSTLRLAHTTDAARSHFLVAPPATQVKAGMIAR